MPMKDKNQMVRGWLRRWSRLTAGLVAAAVLTMTGLAATAHPAHADFTSGLLNSWFGGNSCLDADLNGGGIDGNYVQVWTCNGWANQHWNFTGSSNGPYTIQSAQWPWMCLDADLNSIGRDGTKVQLWHCNGWTNQQWYFRNNNSSLQNGWNWPYGGCLDGDINGPANGAKAQLWGCNQSPEQTWSYHS